MQVFSSPKVASLFLLKTATTSAPVSPKLQSALDKLKASGQFKSVSATPTGLALGVADSGRRVTMDEFGRVQTYLPPTASTPSPYGIDHESLRDYIHGNAETDVAGDAWYDAPRRLLESGVRSFGRTVEAGADAQTNFQSGNYWKGLKDTGRFAAGAAGLGLTIAGGGMAGAGLKGVLSGANAVWLGGFGTPEARPQQGLVERALATPATPYKPPSVSAQVSPDSWTAGQLGATTAGLANYGRTSYATPNRRAYDTGPAASSLGSMVRDYVQPKAFGSGNSDARLDKLPGSWDLR